MLFAAPPRVFVSGSAATFHRDVVLLERTARLGGQLTLAGSAPGSEELSRAFLRNAEHQLASARVEVRLGNAADVEDVRALAPDAVIVATGARPYCNDRLPLRDLEVLHAWDVLAGRIPIGARGRG